MAWNLEDYEPVEDRLAKFWNDFPPARIETELLSHEGGQFIVLARLYRMDSDDKPFATGLAEEIRTERGVNSTSALENAETSAIGRALANAGYATKGKRASREEMTKVAKGGGHKVEHPWKPVGKTVSVETTDRGIEAKYQSFEKEIPNEPETVVWEDFEPKAFQDDGTFLETVTQSLGASVTGFKCKHGDMILKDGMGKTGKPYHGFVCGARSKADQCDPRWAKLVSGKWVFEGKATD